MKIGRNAACPCGSGKKYKKCHLLLETPEPTPSSAGNTLYERNIRIVDAVREVFRPPGDDILQLKTMMTPDRIRSFYRTVDATWPRDTDVYPLLKQDTSGLRALYNGDARPELLAQNIFRFTLYSDEILIVDPFMLPWAMRDAYSPVKTPEQYRSDTLKLAFLTLALEPWIRAGIVQYIPDPTDHDMALKSEFIAKATRRIKAAGPERRQDEAEDVKRLEPLFKQEYMRQTYSLPPERIAKAFRSGGMPEHAIPGAVEYSIRQRNADPFALEDEGLDAGQLVILRSAGNLETTMLIAEATGAFPYTDMLTRWHELLGAANDINEVSRLWTPLTRAFSELPMQFLNNVDPEFAYRMREEERLESLRKFLRKLWRDVSASADAGTMERRATVFAEELKSEYNAARADWTAINRDFEASSKKAAWTAGLAGAGGALATGFLSVAVSALGFGVALRSDLKRRNQRFEEFRQKVPMSVFIDLAQSEPKSAPF